jgi:hypothetical protein
MMKTRQNKNCEGRRAQDGDPSLVDDASPWFVVS